VVDDVTVREDQAVWRKNESRSLAALCTAIVTAADVDRDDGRADELHGAHDRLRVGIENLMFEDLHILLDA
jgi:hypothetical protein